jgi:hypothetical protein
VKAAAGHVGTEHARRQRAPLGVRPERPLHRLDALGDAEELADVAAGEHQRAHPLAPPGRGEVVEQRGQALRDGVAGGVVAVTHRRHLAPLLDGGMPAGDRRRVDFAAECDDPVGAPDVVGRERVRLVPVRLQPVGAQPGDDVRRDLGVGLDPGGRGADREAALGGQAAEVRGGDHALRGAVEADEQHDGRVSHDRSSGALVERAARALQGVSGAGCDSVVILQ